VIGERPNDMAIPLCVDRTRRRAPPCRRNTVAREFKVRIRQFRYEVSRNLDICRIRNIKNLDACVIERIRDKLRSDYGIRVGSMIFWAN
jgi:hypothetical protein